MLGAMTIVEHAKDSDDLTRGVTDLFSASSDVLEVMPFVTIKGNAYRYSVEDTLPGIAFRGVNEGYTPSIGTENPQTESLVIAGGDMDVDKFLIRTQGEARRLREMKKKAKQMARSVTTAIIHGDNFTNPKEFDGLANRLVGPQRLRNSTASGGGPLSLQALDDLIASVVEPTHLIMNRRFRDVLFPALSRNQTLMGNAQIMTEPNAVDPGRRTTSYNGLPILVGYEVGPDASLLPFTEPATNGGALQTCSVYCVSFKEDHVCGIQSQPMEARDLGEIDDAPLERVRCEWDVGMKIENGYAAARLTDVTNEPIAA